MTVHDDPTHPPAAVLDPQAGRPGRTERFVELSTCLTGFDRVTLMGTGLADTYRRTADTTLPGGVLDDLLDAFERVPVGDHREAAVASTILADPKLGPVARNVILLWYCGTWTTLPAEWQAAYGASPLDTDHVVAAESYQAGLQWVVAGAHPAGARQQGYGAWSVAPEGSRA
jgi:hypothetical protein